MLLLLAAEAFAQPAQTSTIAEVLFREGQQLLAAGRVPEACAKFSASQKAEPALGTLLNLAVCHEREGKTATAWLEYSEIASLSRQAGDGAREKYAQTRMGNLDSQLHRVALDAAEPVDGIVLWLDQTKVPPAMFGVGIPVDPGEHEVRATAPGRSPYSYRFITTAEPGTEQLTVPALKPEKPAAPPPAPGPATASSQPASSAAAPPPSSPSEDKSSKLDLRLFAYGSAGLAVVALGTSVYFGVSAANHASRRDELCPPGPACYDQEAFHEHHLAEVDRTWMLVTGGIGLAAAGAATVLFLVPNTKGSGSAGFRAAPWLTGDVYGATAEGRF